MPHLHHYGVDKKYIGIFNAMQIIQYTLSIDNLHT